MNQHLTGQVLTSSVLLMADNDMATRKDHRNNAGCVLFGCDYGHHNAGCALSTQPAPVAHIFENCSHRPDYASAAEHDRDCPIMEYEFSAGEPPYDSTAEYYSQTVSLLADGTPNLAGRRHVAGQAHLR